MKTRKMFVARDADTHIGNVKLGPSTAVTDSRI